jgi:hypothetical protein
MKKQLLSFCLIAALGSSAAIAQTVLNKNLGLNAKAELPFEVATDLNKIRQNRATVEDEIGYTFGKQALKNADSAATSLKWTAAQMNSTQYYNGYGQIFDAPQQVSISGVYFLGAGFTGTALGPVDVEVAILDKTGSSLGTATITAEAVNLYKVEFSAPIIVQDTFIVSLMPKSTNFLYLRATNWRTESGMGEGLSLGYYQEEWYTFLNDDPQYNIDWDFIVEPIVSYTTAADFNLSATSVAAGADVQVTNTSSPIFGSRFYNVYAFMNKFNNATDSTFFWNLGGTTAYAESGVFSSNTAGVYDITLTATLRGWTKIYTEEATKKVTVGSVSVANISNEASISVFPNPSNGTINVKTSSVNSTVEVFNTLGAVVAKVSSNGNSTINIDLTSQPKGVYFVKVSGSEGVVIKKISLQ